MEGFKNLMELPLVGDAELMGKAYGNKERKDSEGVTMLGSIYSGKVTL